MMMKRIFPFSILFSLFLSVSAIAQEADTSAIFHKDSLSLFSMSIEELLNVKVNSVSKQEENLAEAPMSVSKINKDELNRWGVRNLYETLQRIPGYTFYNTDYYGQYGVISRGCQSIWRFGYSVELMPVVDFGHMNFAPQFFKSVEVARGPGGLAWGSNALAGLINGNLRDDLEGVEAVASYGNQNYYNLTAMAGQKFKTGNEEDGFFIGFDIKGMDYASQQNAFGIPGNEYKMNGLNPSQNMIAKIKYKWLKTIVQYDHSDHVAPYLWFGEPYQYDSTTNQWNKTLIGTLFDSIKAKTGQPAHDQLLYYATRNEIHLPLNSDHFDIFIYHNYFKRSWFLDPVATLGDSRHDLGFGFNYNSKNQKFNISAGGDLWGRSKLQMHYYTSTFAQDYGIDWFANTLAPINVDYRNIFTQLSYRFLEKFKLTLGARVDYQKNARKEFVYTGPRIGLVYASNEYLTFKYLYNSAPRRPQSNELFGNTPNPETLSAHEISAFLSKSKFSANITLFYQQLKNQITRATNTNLNAFVNTGGLRTQGIEWAINFLPAKKWLIYFNGSAYEAKVIKGYVDDNGVTKEVSERHNSKSQPLFVPLYTGFLGTEYNIANILKVNVAWRSIYKIPYIELDNITEGYKYANFFDMTLTSKRFWSKLEVSFIALNIFNSQNQLPAYGEHAGNRNGTIAPEGNRFYLRTRINM
jgi:outer membrane receptor protein involved in Fe transport